MADRGDREQAVERAKDVLHERTDICAGADECVARPLAAAVVDAAYPEPMVLAADLEAAERERDEWKERCILDGAEWQKRVEQLGRERDEALRLLDERERRLGRIRDDAARELVRAERAEAQLQEFDSDRVSRKIRNLHRQAAHLHKCGYPLDAAKVSERAKELERDRERARSALTPPPAEGDDG